MSAKVTHKVFGDSSTDGASEGLVSRDDGVVKIVAQIVDRR